MANRNTHYYTTLCAWPQLNANQSLSNLLSKSSLASFSASSRCLNSSFPVSDDKSSISLTEAEAWSSKGFTFSCCWKALGLVWSSQVGCFAFFGRMNLYCWARPIMVNLPCGCFRRCIHTKLRRRFPAGWSSRQIRLLKDRLTCDTSCELLCILLTGCPALSLRISIQFCFRRIVFARQCVLSYWRTYICPTCTRKKVWGAI